MQLFNQVKEKGKEKNQKLLQNEHVFSLLHSNKKKKTNTNKKTENRTNAIQPIGSFKTAGNSMDCSENLKIHISSFLVENVCLPSNHPTKN